MSRFIEIDLSDYEDDVFDYAEKEGFKSLSDLEDEYIEKCILEDFINELEKEVYLYTTKSITSVEDVLNRLKEIV